MSHREQVKRQEAIKKKEKRIVKQPLNGVHCSHHAMEHIYSIEK